MAVRNKQKGSSTLIEVGTLIKGEIVFDNELFVMGEVEGNLNSGSDLAKLIVSKTGKVQGEIRVPNVVINGTIVGNVSASENLEITGTARIFGDLHYSTIEVQGGSLITGRLVAEKIKLDSEGEIIASEETREGS
jgi:cytoskeletal protein CcmA (bactofilin family)